MATWEELPLDQALVILMDWLGHRVWVRVDAASDPRGVVLMEGTLKAAPHTVGAVEHDVDAHEYSFGFEETPGVDFRLIRGAIIGYDGTRRLLVEMGARGEDRGEVMLTIERGAVGA